MSLFAALEKEASLRWEANMRAGQWVAAFCGCAALVAFWADAVVGLATLTIALASFGWFTTVRCCTHGAVASVFRAVTPALTLAIPSIVLVVVTATSDLATAFTMWTPPLITVCVLGLSTARLEPLRPFAYSVVATVFYVASYLWLTRHVTSEQRIDLEMLNPTEQIERVIFLLGSGVALSMVTRGLRSALKRAERRTRENDLFGKYRLGGEIAQGGMATVVDATYCPEGGFERPVAIKRIHAHLATLPEIVSAFRAEAELGARLAHPNIVAVLDFGRVDDSYFLAMERIDGVDLRALTKRLRRRRVRLPARLAGFIAHEMLQGLAFAHAGARDRDGQLLRVVHRDLSPGNVMITRSGDVKITDFGIACALKKAARHHTGRIIGSLSYLAPEQAAQRSFDHRADLFAVGVLLHEMLSMKRLFKRDTTAKTLLAILQDDVPLVGGKHGVPCAWDSFLARALAKDPSRRFTSARAMADAIQAILLADDDTLPHADDLAAFLISSRALELEPELALIPTVPEVLPDVEATMPVELERAARRDISAA
jgi:eukaryotic-like serine/threonine-protein kinase